MLSASVAFALDPAKHLTQYVHDSWTTNEGLPQDSINQIVQTPDGYLWVATQEGIARFDGTRFTVFDSRTTSGIVRGFVSTLFVDRAGTLWAGASGGLLRYDGLGTFTKVNVSPGISGSAEYLSEDDSGTLWIGFGEGREGGGKGLLRLQNGRGRVFTVKDGLPSNQVYQTWTDRSGALWICTASGLSVMRGGTLTTYTTADGLPDNLVREVREDREGTIWLGTSRGLTSFDGKSFTTFTSRDGLLADHVEAIYEDRHGVLWIGTAKGVNRFLDGKLEAAPLPGIGDDRIFGFFEDRERSLWIGTHAAGLHRLRSGKFTPWGPPEGLIGSNVTGIFQDSSGRIWMGTSPGGVNVLDRGTLSTYSTREGLLTNDAKAFQQDRSGEIWIGTTEGIGRFANGQFTQVDSSEGMLRPSVNVTYEDQAGTIWAGTNRGLGRILDADGMGPMRGRLEPFPLPPAAPSVVRVIHEVLRGKLLIAGGDGAGFLEGNRYTPLLTGTFATAQVMGLHVDRDGTLWLPTWGEGLLRVRDGRVTRYSSATGLFDDTIWSILDDGRGNFWMGSNRGIFRVSRQQLEDLANRRIATLRCISFGSADGMRRRETNAGNPAALRARDGRLWFGTTAGAVVIDPARIPVNPLAPNVVIERFVANEKEQPLQAPLVLQSGSSSLEVHYVALSLVTPSRVQYRFKLEGFDDHWIDAGARRSAYYTNIDPGTYTFRVRAANEDGVWNDQGAAITFRIRRVFYKTWWFLTLVGLSLILLAGLLNAARKRQLEIRHRVYHDPLTGLANRFLLTERAEVARVQAERRGRSIAILFLDLDGFKGVNDRYGHAAGDRLLQLVADRLRACIREIDTLARIGGDEFAVLVADLEDESRAADVAQGMIDAVSAQFTLDDERVTLGVSIGIAFHPFDGRDVPTMLQAADRAMYRAKLAGGNEYQYNAADRDEVLVL